MPLTLLSSPLFGIPSDDTRRPPLPQLAAEEEAEIAAITDADLKAEKEHLNIVFIGHVDAGKSTIGGQILFLAGMVDERTIQKYEREAKDKNRESWYMAYIMDVNEEERAKGKTVETARGFFETDKRRYTVLDAPGHKNYVPSMISGAAQADVAVLVIAARKGEFETGFERGGQTREHAQLAKTLGVSKLVVVVNKMDTQGWGEERFDEIVNKITPFLKQCGYNTKKDVTFIPISGLSGANIRDPVDGSECGWWASRGKGATLFNTLDNLEAQDRDPRAPFRLPVIDKYKDSGCVVMGKVEAGTGRVGSRLVMMPNKQPVKVLTVHRDEDEVQLAGPGENVKLKLSDISDEEVSTGFVLSSCKEIVPVVQEFDVQLAVLELLEHKSIFTAGYTAVMHIHTACEEIEVSKIISQIDPKTKKPMDKKVSFVKGHSIIICRMKAAASVCLEKFSTVPQLGRFTLRDEGKTIAIGKILKLKDPAAARARREAAKK